MTYEAGAINSSLNIDRSPFQRDLAAARKEALDFSNGKYEATIGLNGLTKVTADLDNVKRQLDGLTKDVRTVRLEAQTGVAQAKIDKVKASLDGIHDRRVRLDVDGSPAEGELDRVKARADGTVSRMHLIVGAIVAATTVVAPLLAAAGGITLGLGALGAVGLLAFKGIQAEIQNSTQVGRKWQQGLQEAKGDLGRLESTAASGLLGPFRNMLTDINRQMPFLNSEVARLSANGGVIGQNLLQATLVGFRALSPLLNQVDGDLVHLSQRILGFANGGGLERFTSYAQQELPRVEEFLSQLFTTVGHLAIGMSGFGSVGLTTLSTLSRVINAIPLPVMKALVPLIAAGYLGWQAYNGAVKPIIDTYEKATKVLKAYEAAQLVEQGLTREQAMAQASAAGGLGAAASKYGVIGGIFLAVAGTIIGANDAIASHFRTTAASASDAEVVLNRIAGTGRYTSDDLKALGVASGNLNSIMENAFRESNWTKLKDFEFGMNNIIKTPFNSATDDRKNFFKSIDGGLSDLVSNGKLNLAQTYLQNLSAQTGISIDQLTAKLPQYKTAIDNLANSALPVFGPGGVLMASTATLEAQADALGITSQQAQKYANMVGISADQVKLNTISEADLEKAINGVSHAYNTGNQATQSYLAAVQAFSDSAGTAADRAALIGATLVHANGDNLQYATSMNAAATANQALVNAMHDGALKTVNWKNGLIDFNNAAADPLIRALDQLQQSAEGAAEAQYQHELNTRGAKQAADDAYTTYVSRTQSALIDEAQKFGMNADQAKRFADQYFGLADAKDIKKKIEQAGGDSVIKVLQNIADDLDIIAGKKPRPVIDANTGPATAKINSLNALLNQITQPRTIPVTPIIKGPVGTLPGTNGTLTIGSLGGDTPQKPHKAMGGLLNGPGSGTSDSMLIRASNGEYVVNARATAANLPLLDHINQSVPAFASGGLVPNPFTGISYTGPPKRSSSRTRSGPRVIGGITYASVAAAQNAIARFTQAVLKDSQSVMAALSGSASTLAARTSKLIADAEKTGEVSSGLARQISAENSRLIADARKRDQIATQLKTANTNLANAQKAYNTQYTAGQQGVLGTFDASTGGGGTSLIGFQADLNQKVASAQKFANNIALLRREGLNNSALQQIIAAGPAQGGVNASMLAAANGTQIAQINASYKALGGAANSVGKAGADALYGAGVAAALGIVRGLQSQEKTLVRAMNGLATTMIRALQSALRIHSPSEEIADQIGVHIPGGLGLGVTRGTPAAIAAVKDMANKVKYSAGFDIAPIAAGSPPTVTSSSLLEEIRQLRKDLKSHGTDLSDNLSEAFEGAMSRHAQRTHDLTLIRMNQNGGR